ncbi:MAG: hypothetical protein NC322_05255 [Alistipes senegalensis]|nr:hypothetical protein [Alistipes senegalensis]
MSRGLILFAALVLACGSAAGQNIRGRYVSRADDDGTIYHLLPVTLFESRSEGDLTFDLTYKAGPQGRAVLNFTYFASAPTPADSVSFDAGRISLAGPAERFYIEPDKKSWKHRYSLQTDAELVRAFFDETAVPRVIVYSGGVPHPYEVKKSAWRSYAPVGRKIFEMIRLNEAR